MNTKTKQAAETISFYKFLLERPQRDRLLLLSGIYLCITIVIGQLFPYPFTTADTGNYVLCAQTNIYGGYRPMGYSGFIRFFHGFGSSVHFVYIWQSIFNYFAVITFLFTIQYFFHLKKIVFYSVSIILILHPDILHNTNTLLSDSLFNSLTIIWITTAIWMIMDRNIAAAILHCVVLYFLINVRYIGLFYPVISSLLFIVRFKQWKFLSALALVPIVILITTVQHVKKTTEAQFGQDTFSAFSGWASANNAVAMIPYIDLKPEEITDPEIRALHQLVKQFGDSCYTWNHIKDTDFMWDKKWPGKALLGYNIQSQRMPYINAWIYSGMQWKRYGDYLKKKFPVEYAKHFLLPNTGGVFEVFPYGAESEYIPDNTSKQYFQINTDKYIFKTALFNDVYGYRLILYWTMMIAFIAICIFMIWKRKTFFVINNSGLLILFLIAFVFLYIGMSIYTHPIQNYRYLIPVYPAVMAVIAIAGSRAVDILR